MPLPKHFEIYRVFLQSLSDGELHYIKDCYPAVIQAFSVTPEERNQLLPSGNRRIFEDRVSWCRTYLKKAGLVDSPMKGRIRITPRGLQVLVQYPEITDQVLLQFPEFAEFKLGKRHEKETVIPDPKQKEKSKPKSKTKLEKDTPRATLEESYRELNQSLADDLLVRILEVDPYAFEQLVVDLLIQMGYGKLQYHSRVTPKSGDEGIDGIVSADKLGFDSIYIQAKKYASGTVGRPEIQKFVGALAGQGAQKGIFITTSQFSKEAVEYAEKNLNYKLVLVDGNRLAELMIEYELGVSVESVYKVKRIDSDYFSQDLT